MKTKLVTFLVVFTLISSVSLAGNNAWQGLGGDDCAWSTANNWQFAVPNSTQTVAIFLFGAEWCHPVITPGVHAHAKDVWITGIAPPYEIPPVLEITGGTLTSVGDLTTNPDEPFGIILGSGYKGILRILGGTVTSPHLSIGRTNTGDPNVGILAMAGGEATFDILDVGFHGEGRAYLAGGILTADGYLGIHPGYTDPCDANNGFDASYIDLAGGTFRYNRALGDPNDVNDYIQGFIDAGQIKAYGVASGEPGWGTSNRLNVVRDGNDIIVTAYPTHFEGDTNKD